MTILSLLLNMADAFKKNLMFTIVLLSLLCGSLICTSLLTNHWIESQPWRKLNPLESSGQLYFGLLYGRKELNVAIGLRHHDIKVSEMIEKHPTLMSRSLWNLTLISVILALLFAIFSAFLALINLVIKPNIKIFSTSSVCYINLLAFILCLCSTCFWTIQYVTKLSYNVLLKDDLDNYWTTEGRTFLGFSFWLIVVAAILHLISIFLVKYSTLQIKLKNKRPMFVTEEKSAGAIMLY